MAYADRPVPHHVVERSTTLPVTDYHDRVRWGSIIAGLMVALSTQLVLSALGAAIGLTSLSGSGAPRTDAGGVGSTVSIWAVVSLFLSSQLCNSKTL